MKPDHLHHDPSAGAGLAKDLKTMIAQAEALRGDVHAAERARKAANKINMAGLFVLLIFVGLLIAIGWQNNKVITEVQATNAAIAACSTPGEPCYENGRKRTEAAISAVVRISIFVSECGRLWPGESGPDYDRKLEACVMGRLAAAVGQPGPPVSPASPPAVSPAPSATR